MRAAAAVALATLALGACGSPASAPARHLRSGPSHVVLLVLENEERSSVIGSAEAPYLTSLAHRYATAPRSFAMTHPSLPNYLALVSGSTQGIRSDCGGCRVSGPNLAAQLEAAGLSWKAYEEGMPRPCFRGVASGRYAKKHDPFAYWDSVDCRRRVGFGALDADLRARRLPAFALVVPDLCHDMHDCAVATGDRFLARLIPRVLAALGPHGYLVVTFDEGSSDAGCCRGQAHGGRVATIVAGPDVARGRVATTAVDHAGVLGTIEDSLGVERLGLASDPRSGSLHKLFR